MVLPPLRYFYSAIILFSSILGWADDLRIEIKNESEETVSSVEVRSVSSADEALAQIYHDRERLAGTQEIVIVDDLRHEPSAAREELLRNPNVSYLPFQLTEKIAAAQSLRAVEDKLPGVAGRVEEHFRQQVQEYKKLRVRVTLVKAVFVGVVNYFLYLSTFDHLVLPTLLWACSTAAMTAGFQWHAPEINRGYRTIVDALFSKVSFLKRFVVPEDGHGGAPFYKIRHRIVKKLAVIGIGGFTVTTLFHLVGTTLLYGIGMTLAPDSLLRIINELGYHFNDLTISALLTGFGVNVLFSSIKELLVDVAPSCFLTRILSERGLSPDAKRRAMAWGSALIGGAATVLVMASQILPIPNIKILVWSLSGTGAAYLIYRYALRELFSLEFLREIAQDFRLKGAGKLLAILEARKAAKLARQQARESAEEREDREAEHRRYLQSAPSCLILLRQT